MDDLISRQAAIDALIELTIQRDKWDDKEGFAQKRGIDAAICAVEDLPSAERRGWWINGKCSVCGGHASIWAVSKGYYKSNYCPNCGAKMMEV